MSVVISCKTNEEINNQLVEIAKSKEWSKSQTVDKILTFFLQDKKLIKQVFYS